MATWTAEEKNVILQYLQQKEGPITTQDYTQLQQHLKNRSIASIKKKCLELKHQLPHNQQMRHNQQMEHNQQSMTSKTSKWSKNEKRTLIKEYVKRDEKQVTKRVKAIMHLFPGRSEKAIATQLRENHPDIYYMKKTTISDTDSEEDEEGQAEPIQQNNENIQNEINPLPEPMNVIPTTIDESHLEEPKSPEQLENHEQLENIRVEFMKTAQHIGRNKLRIQKFFIKKVHRRYVQLVDKVLEENIYTIEKRKLTELNKRKLIKKYIYVAGVMIRKHVYSIKKKSQSKYLETEEKIKKLERRVRNANKILNFKGGRFSKELKDEATEMKKLKMGPKQYIKTTTDRIIILKDKAQHQKIQSGINRLRYNFKHKPSLKLLEKPPNNSLELKRVENFFQNLYTQKGDTTDTPILNKWLGKLQKLSTGKNYNEQLNEDGIAKIIDRVIAKSAAWKSPGEDCINNYLYKILPSAKRYIKGFITNVIKGKMEITEIDVRATVILIYKKGDIMDPTNYRPIALANTDYKVLTATIREILTEALPEWAIPNEQLARKNTWGTIQGLLQDKAISQLAKKGRKKHYSAWYDFNKAFDSMSHRQIRRLFGVLPLNINIKNLLRVLLNLWSLQILIKKEKTKPIYVKTGIYQGDSISSLIFILLTAAIIDHLKTDPLINKYTRGQHHILAYMDDIKVHANSKQSLKIITKELKDAASELGLTMNQAKCGAYSREGIEKEDDDAPFLPEVRDGYTYLGLDQLERDTSKNYDKIREKITSKVDTIFKSELTTRQKITLFNTSVIPSVIYVMGNIYPSEKRSTTLKNCREMDTLVRNKLVENNMKGKTTSNARIYLHVNQGGLGMRSVELETEIQMVRKGIYLQTHPEMGSALEAFKKLNNAGWRNPIEDHDFVIKKYDCPNTQYNITQYKQHCEQIIEHIRRKYAENIRDEWQLNMSYGRAVIAEDKNINFPAHLSPFMDSWRLSLLISASEEQLHGLGCIPGRRRKCRRGCNVDETAYHVVSACPNNAYITRHDNVVHWVIKTILNSMEAPLEIINNFQFGRATLNTDFLYQQHLVSIRAGNKILTEKRLYHNKPDIFIKMHNRIIIIEVAVAHIQNYRLQERIKRTRYAINSCEKVDNKNVNTITRDLNIVGELAKLYRCPVDFAVFVVGCYGEMITTEEHKNFLSLLQTKIGVGKEDMEQLKQKCCYSVAISTSQILLRHLNSQDV